jgi:hypothetical protein
MFGIKTAEAREWTEEEKIWGTVAGTMLLGDWTTTRYGSRHWQEGYYEKNLILGKQPHTDKVDLYFLMVIPAAYLAADYFSDYRKMILMTLSATELVMINNNLSIGLKLKF